MHSDWLSSIRGPLKTHDEVAGFPRMDGCKRNCTKYQSLHLEHLEESATSKYWSEEDIASKFHQDLLQLRFSPSQKFIPSSVT